MTTGLEEAAGARWVDYHGYSRCVALENGDTRVVLGPHAGGRVLEFALQGQNALFLDPAQAGWHYQEGEPTIHITGGRCDIGPEHTIPRHPLLWLGPWKAEITGPRSARLTSTDDPATGTRLVRDFELDASTARLIFTQTMVNVGDRVTQWCHWSRTFAPHGGVGIVPLTQGRPDSRFPKGYVMYGPGPAINFRPEDPAIRRLETPHGAFLVIQGVPQYAKLGFDSYAGWFAYLCPNNLLFVKRFPTYPDRVYNEVAALTSCIYYPKEEFVELEPIGPRETLAPGEAASFTEEWYLLPSRLPAPGATLDVAAVASVAEKVAHFVQ